LKSRFGTEARLVAGGGGIFDVAVDGKIVFSKFDAGRFPSPDEVAEAISKLSG
jgi:selT/selW/selH-like putative selenoprotein